MFLVGKIIGTHGIKGEVKVINEGSMLKKAVVEIYTFATAEEREEYLKNNKAKKEINMTKKRFKLKIST